MKACQLFSRLAVMSALLSGLLLPLNSMAQVSLQISPSAAGPQYNGLLTVQIGGLTNGEAVALSKFLDVNGNGSLDSADLCVQRMKVTDGQASVIAGVTNVNAPGDLDATVGSAKIQIDFFKAGFEQRLPGKYIFEVASPSGRFAPVRALFTITNSGDAQSISGSVLSGATPVPYAWIVVFQGQAFNSYPIASALANSSGQYSISLPPGTYAVAGVQTNYVTDIPSIPTVTLTAGNNATANLAVIPATQTISGDLIDPAHSNSTFPAIGLPLVSSDNRFAFGLTDTNGHFNIPVTASTWKVNLDEQDNLPMFRSVYKSDGMKIDATAGSVSGLTIPLTRGTALIYGSVRDGQNNPLPGLSVSADDQNGNHGVGESDLSGYYVAAVIGGQWYLSFDSRNGAYSNYAFSHPDQIVVNDGQAVRQDIVGIVATNTISGYLKDSSGTPLGGIGIWANATIGNTQFNVNAQTDQTGYYSFAVANGSWTIGVNNQGDQGLPSSYIAPDNQTITINNNSSTVNFNVFSAPYKINGTVKSSTGTAIGNVWVYARAQINGTQFQTGALTDGNGNFSISAANATWSVGISCNGNPQSLSQLGYNCVGEQSVTIANGNGNVSFTVQPFSAVQIDTAWLPDGNVGSSYSVQLWASGGSQPYSWSLAPGSAALPSGLSLSSIGTINGIPTTTGTNSFVVRVSDSNGSFTDKGLSLNITLPFQPTISSPARLADGHFSMKVMGSPGQTYTVLSTTNLGSGWNPLFVTNAPTDGFIIVDPTPATNDQRYYRLQINP